MRITLSQKFMSVLVAMTILFGALPIVAYAAESISTSVADPATVEDWKNWFPENNTRYAGGIYTDKSVYTAKDAVARDSYFYDIANKLSFGKDNFGNDNFLVSLSAVGSTMEIKGTANVPSDTIFVLDMSNSMSTTEISEMVKATNRAIESLLKNPNSRVGVVLYSSSGNNAVNANATSGMVILPVAHYTTNITATEQSWVKVDNDYVMQNVTYNRYLVANSGAISIASSYRNNIQVGGVTVTGQSTYLSGTRTKRGATYTQAGLWNAYGAYPSGDATKTEDGVQRKPILVLMTDGAPTVATTSYTNIGTSNVGNGNNTNAETSFITQLTASYLKKQIKDKYNGEEPLYYTLGLGVGNDGYAVGVLDPGSTNNLSAKYWNDLADDGVTGTISFEKPSSGKAVKTTISGDMSILKRNYVDKYYSANNVADMAQMFESIVENINLVLRKYPTLVSEGNAKMDGYISFTDEIGRFMEIKDIKGIHIGEGSLVTGGMFAEYVSTGKMGNIQTGQLTELGTTLIDALESRFGINENVALQMLQNAITSDNKQIYFNNASDFSNCVAWYADENNNFITHYSMSDKNAPAGAKYRVKSYLYLGSASGDNGQDTDMLYILIRVREDIETGLQVLDANMPASLLPIVTYTVEIDGVTLEASKIKSMTSNIDSVNPACLLFEVGLDSDIDAYNVAEVIKVFEDEQGYVYPKNADGTYSFYTNRWRTEQKGNVPETSFTVPNEEDLPSGIYNHGLIGSTEAHYNPAVTNQRYYYTEDIVVLVKDGESYVPYVGNTAPGGTGYYHIYTWIEKNGDNYSIASNYNPILTDALSKAVRTDDGWVIPKGTPKRYFGEVEGDLHSGHLHKSENTTSTLLWSLYPASSYESSGTAQGYHVFNYLGNNGKVTVTPAQGIRLSKTVSEVVENGPDSFDFTIALSVDGTFDYRLVNSNGTYTEGTLRTNNKEISVTVSDGQVLYISGVPTGAEYYVVEEYTPEYVGSSTNQRGIVAEKEFSYVDFVNAPRGNGSLLVSKEIMHPFTDGVVRENMANEEFAVTVTFSGESSALSKIVGIYENNVLTSNDGGKTFTFTLKDGEDALFSNIPEGVTYEVVETISTEQKGYSLDAEKSSGLVGTITKDTQSHADIVNKYTFNKVQDYTITVSGTKFVRESEGLEWNDETFQIALYKVNAQSGVSEQVGTIQIVSKSNPNYTFVIDETVVALDEVGLYHFHVEEIIPDEPVLGMAYDTSVGGFNVMVNDLDADGYLEIVSVVSPVGNTITDAGDEDSNTYNVVKNFENIFNSTNITLPVEKRIVDNSGAIVTEISKGGFIFGLYDSNTLIYNAATDVNGNAYFNIPIKMGESKSYKLKEIVPLIDTAIPGMTYSNEEYEVSVKWENGANAPEYVVTGNVTTPVITNIFDEVYSTPAITLSGNKTLNGGTLRENDSFFFEIYETDADYDISGHEYIERVSVDYYNDDIEFSPIQFNTVGTKYLVVREVNGGGIINGVKYDVTRYHITLNVVKKFDGNSVKLYTENIVVHQTGNGIVDVDEIDFNNEYSIRDEKSVIIRGVKDLVGRDFIAKEFTFGLVDESDNIVYKAVNEIDGTFEFNALVFHEVGVYKYYVKELAPEDAETVDGKKFFEGVTYDDTIYEVIITLTDNGKGKMNLNVTVDGNDYTDDIIKFVNHYEAEGSAIILEGYKILKGREFRETDNFYFELYSADKDFVPVSDIPVATAMATIKNEGNVSDYAINYAFEDGEEGVHRYILKERIPEEITNGIGYDTMVYYITVMVVDNSKGQLNANVFNITGAGTDHIFHQDALVFTNVYNAFADDVSVDFYVKKTVNNVGSEKIGAENFTFELTGDAKQTVKTDEYGNGIFVMNYTKDDIGKTFNYVIKEVDDNQDNVIYDDAIYDITVNVKLGDDDQLIVETIMNEEPVDTVVAQFENVYDYTPNVDNNENPNTGDLFKIELWVALLFVSGVGILGAKKMVKKEEEF